MFAGLHNRRHLRIKENDYVLNYFNQFLYFVPCIPTICTTSSYESCFLPSTHSSKTQY